MVTSNAIYRSHLSASVYDVRCATRMRRLGGCIVKVNPSARGPCLCLLPLQPCAGRRAHTVLFLQLQDSLNLLPSTQFVYGLHVIINEQVLDSVICIIIGMLSKIILLATKTSSYKEVGGNCFSWVPQNTVFINCCKNRNMVSFQKFKIVYVPDSFYYTHLSFMHKYSTFE